MRDAASTGSAAHDARDERRSVSQDTREERRFLSQDAREERAGWWLVAPSAVLIIVLLIVPTLAMLGLSVTDFELGEPDWHVVGLQNYIESGRRSDLPNFGLEYNGLRCYRHPDFGHHRSRHGDADRGWRRLQGPVPLGLLPARRVADRCDGDCLAIFDASDDRADQPAAEPRRHSLDQFPGLQRCRHLWAGDHRHLAGDGLCDGAVPRRADCDRSPALSGSGNRRREVMVGTASGS